jgi:hypothetical protein
MKNRSYLGPFYRNHLFMIYVTIVTAILTWQSITYTGLLRFLGEWQFSKIGTFFPVATQLSLLLTATLPVFAWLRFRERRGRTSAEPVDDLARACASSALIGLIYTIIASSLAVSALVTLGMALMAFQPQGQSRTLSVAEAAKAASGPVQLMGYADKSRMIEIEEDIVMGKRTIFVVPMLAYPGDRKEIGYFVPVVANDGKLNVRIDPAPRAITTGYLKKHGMPEEAASLLRAKGYPVRHRAALLYKSPADAAWSGLTSGILISVLAILFSVGARIEARRYRRLAGSASAANDPA